MNENENPQSRNEALLQNILGDDNETGAPQSRVEAILQNMLGANNALEEPQSRNEKLLMEILEQGAGGGGGGGSEDFAITDTSNLFKNGSRLENFDDLKKHFSGNTTTCEYMFQYASSGITNVDLNFDTSNCELFTYMFQGCPFLETAPSYDLSKARYCSYMFASCSALENVPVYNLSTSNFNNSGHQNMFQYCTALTDESLNNIMASLMTIRITLGTVSKTLKYVGLTSDQATRCQNLSNYQAFTEAGWTTGY